jgi:hypothetical protein
MRGRFARTGSGPVFGWGGQRHQRGPEPAGGDSGRGHSCRSHASGSGARGFDADSWGLPGTFATWAAPTGMLAASRAPGCGGCTSCGCVYAVCSRSPRGPGPRFGRGGALRCFADSGSPSPINWHVNGHALVAPPASSLFATIPKEKKTRVTGLSRWTGTTTSTTSSARTRHAWSLGGRHVISGKRRGLS